MGSKPVSAGLDAEDAPSRREDGILRAVFRCIDDAIVVLDDNDEVVLANPAATRLLGVEREVRREDLQALTLDPVSAPLGGDARTLGADAHVLAPAGPVSVEGTLSPVDGGADPFRGTVLVLRDARARRAEAERARRLAALVDAVEVAMFHVGVDGQILTWNAGARHVFRITESEAVGAGLVTLFPSSRRLVLETLLDRIRAGHVVQDPRVELVRRGGGRFDGGLHATPIRDDHGAVTGAFIVVQDVSAVRRIRPSLARRLRGGS